MAHRLLCNSRFQLSPVSAFCACASQAHCNAQSHSDEFVVEGLVSFDKMSVLVQELLVIEVRDPQD